MNHKENPHYLRDRLRKGIVAPEAANPSLLTRLFRK